MKQRILGPLVLSFSLLPLALQAQPVTGLERVQADSPSDSVATKTVQADCPDGKKVVGGGYLFFFGGPTVPIRINVPTLDLRSWLVSATNLDGSDWSVSAIAICADAAG